MKNNIVFVSAYPNDVTVKDGMQQRIVNVDRLALESNKLYLEISFRRNLARQDVVIDDNTTAMHLNFFIHFLFIFKLLLGSDIVYVHSLYNYVKVFPFLLFAKRSKTLKRIFFDFHGVVPEELVFMGMSFRGRLYNFLEKYCISSATDVIFVTNAMMQYIKDKYKSTKFDSLVYSIYPENVFQDVDVRKVEQLKNNLNVTDDDVVFLYSGNAQQWQNIDLMMALIKKHAHVEHFKFVLLTGDLPAFKSKLNEYGLNDCPRVILNSVLPDELAPYYALAHYGFLLRDVHVLNRVANPTKIVEYLYFGMTPIVKYEWIGDYKALGYEYISCSDDLSGLQRKKSSVNAKLLQEVRCSSDSEARLSMAFNG